MLGQPVNADVIIRFVQNPSSSQGGQGGAWPVVTVLLPVRSQQRYQACGCSRQAPWLVLSCCISLTATRDQLWLKIAVCLRRLQLSMPVKACNLLSAAVAPLSGGVQQIREAGLAGCHAECLVTRWAGVSATAVIIWRGHLVPLSTFLLFPDTTCSAVCLIW